MQTIGEQIRDCAVAATYCAVCAIAFCFLPLFFVGTARDFLDHCDRETDLRLVNAAREFGACAALVAAQAGLKLIVLAATAVVRFARNGLIEVEKIEQHVSPNFYGSASRPLSLWPVNWPKDPSKENQPGTLHSPQNSKV